MHIESGTTTEHRVRLGLFLAMVIVFAAYFGYDGLWGYPGKNLEWARQNIPNLPPEAKSQIQINPKVMMAELARIHATARSSAGMTDAQVRAILGDPSAVAEHTAGGAGGKDHWYVGPAACARIQIVDGKVREVAPLENINKSESDIKMQKMLGAILAVVGLGVAVRFLRINTMRTTLDDSGLTARGRQVAWDEMASLDTSDYDRKGWLDVVYRRSGEDQSVRLDSYDIARFDEIVGEICARKGFTNPIKPRQTAQADDAD